MTAPLVPSTHRLGAAVAAAREELAGAAGAPGWALPSEDLPGLVRELLALRAQAEGLLLGVLREADGRGLPGAVGARDLAGWLRGLAPLGAREARELARLAPRLDPQADPSPERAPAVGAALAAGTVSLAQAEAITAALAGLPAQTDTAEPGLRAEIEDWLVSHGAGLDPRGLAAAGRVLHETIVTRLALVDRDDPAEAARAEAGERAERDAYARRSVTRRAHPSGLADVRMLLPAEVAAALFTALDALAAPRRADDGVRDQRSEAQRRADAVEELVAHALDAGRLPERGGVRPHLTVLLDWAALRADLPHAGLLDTGQPLSPAQARLALCDAALLPVVLGGASQPLDAGRARRSFDRYQRAALLARDGGCSGPGCDPHPARTHAHHDREWEHGGPTDTTNGALFCPPWHRKIHLEGWQVRLAPNGHPELIPPTWIDPAQRPRQNARYRTGGLARPPAPHPRT